MLPLLRQGLLVPHDPRTRRTVLRERKGALSRVAAVWEVRGLRCQRAGEEGGEGAVAAGEGEELFDAHDGLWGGGGFVVRMLVGWINILCCECGRS